MATFTIPTHRGKRIIGNGEPCFIIAEVSGNHGQDYDKAEAIIRAAHAAGADAVKLQTYTPDTLTIPCDNQWFRVGGGNPADWQHKTLYQLYTTAYTPWEWQPKLKQVADEIGIVFFSTPFDVTAVSFLEEIGIELYKIGSYEVTNLPLLERVAKTGKPIIMSVGFAELSEITEALDTLRTHGASEIALLHCVTGYSARFESADLHLSNVSDLAERFHVVTGFSENNGGIHAAVQAVLAGAHIVEKHVILDKTDSSPDAPFSLDPAELSELVQNIRSAERAIGTVHYGPVNDLEKYNRGTFRESLFVVADIRSGDTFTSENVRIIRPGCGLPPKYLRDILGRQAVCDIVRGTPLAKHMINGGI